MDFLDTTHLLMDMQMKYPGMRYEFGEHGMLTITLPVDLEVPHQFDQARKMFEPI